MGYSCVIAPSFGDIFFNNCFQTGMLPIVLPASMVSELATEAECDLADASAGKQFTIDLVNQVIVTPGGRRVSFKIDGAKRRALLEGLEEIQMTLTLAAEIAHFQETDAKRRALAGQRAQRRSFRPDNPLRQLRAVRAPGRLT